MLNSRAVDTVTATPDSTRVVVANFLTMGITMVVCAARAWVSIRWKRRLGLDDILLCLGLGAGVTQSILTQQAVKRGLGAYIRPGNSARLKRFEELVYAANMFFIISMAFTKLSVIRMLPRFAPPVGLSRAKITVLQYIVLGWSVFGVFSIAFQCHFPLPWLYTPERCTGSGALWFPILIFSIITDAWLAASIWPVLPTLKIEARQRQITAGLFSIRFITAILTVAQIAVLAPALKNIDQSRALPNPMVIQVLVQNTSIVAAAILCLYKPLAMHSAVYAAQSGTVEHSLPRPTFNADNIKLPELSIQRQPNKLGENVTESEVRSPITDFSSKLSAAFNKEVA